MKVDRDDRYQPFTSLVWLLSCHGNLNNSFVLTPIEFIFDMEVLEDNKHQPHTLLLW